MRLRKTSNFNLSELILVIAIVSMIATITTTVILMITTSLVRNDIEHETGRFIHTGLTELKEEIKNAKQVCTRETHEIVSSTNIYATNNSSEKYFCNGTIPLMENPIYAGYNWLLIKNNDNKEVLYTVENSTLYKESPVGGSKEKVSENVNVHFKQRNEGLEIMKIEVDLMTSKKKDVFHTYDFYINLQNDIDKK